MSAVRKLAAFYRYIYLNQPQLTRLAGIALILAVGVVHLIEAPGYFEAAAYLGALFVANFVATLVSAVGIFGGAKGWGWTLGAVVCGLSALAYLASRLFGLFGLPEAVGEWDEPLGSLALILEGLFIAGWFSVVTGLAVAAPDKRHWHD
jgi:hypothetical protein